MFTNSVEHDQLQPAGRSLWQLTIGDQEKPAFTGLLALRDSGDSLDVALLDSTGIKLLTERIAYDGEIDALSALPLVKKKGLPIFLGKSLYRIFQLGKEKSDTQCSPGILFRRCFGKDAKGRLMKSGHFGPFRLWSVKYFINKEKDRLYLSGVVLNQGWFKPEMRLQRMKR